MRPHGVHCDFQPFLPTEQMRIANQCVAVPFGQDGSLLNDDNIRCVGTQLTKKLPIRARCGRSRVPHLVTWFLWAYELLSSGHSVRHQPQQEGRW